MNCTKNDNVPRDIKANSVTSAHQSLMKLVKTNGKKCIDERNNVTRKVYGVTVRINTNDIDHPIYDIMGAPNIEHAKYFTNGIVNVVNAMEIAGSFDYGYGERLRRQGALESIFKNIQISPTTRRGWVPIYTHDDTAYVIGQQKEVPCCVGVDFLVVGDALCMMVVFRSNDIAIAFPSDAVGFMSLQRKLANALGFEVGEYTHVIASAHYRITDEDVVDAMIKSKPNKHYFEEYRYE